jgi:hypothetical protein
VGFVVDRDFALVGAGLTGVAFVFEDVGFALASARFAFVGVRPPFMRFAFVGARFFEVLPAIAGKVSPWTRSDCATSLTIERGMLAVWPRRGLASACSTS